MRTDVEETEIRRQATKTATFSSPDTIIIIIDISFM
jgi:hypothetical protein